MNARAARGDRTRVYSESPAQYHRSPCRTFCGRSWRTSGSRSIARSASARPQASRHAWRTAPAVRGFAAALEARHPIALIAEVKRASPSAGVIRAEFDPVETAAAYERHGAACVSVLTDERYFHGSLDDLAAVRQAIGLPVLRKDFLIDRYQVLESRAAGADCVLLIAECLDDCRLRELYFYASELGMDALIELYEVENLERVLKLEPALVGVNNRDLRTFVTDLEHTIRLAPRIVPQSPPGERKRHPHARRRAQATTSGRPRDPRGRDADAVGRRRCKDRRTAFVRQLSERRRTLLGQQRIGQFPKRLRWKACRSARCRWNTCCASRRFSSTSSAIFKVSWPTPRLTSRRSSTPTTRAIGRANEVETDPSYKQLIPYCIFRCGEAVFHYRRGKIQGEGRLRGLRSIGIGGHISSTDAETAEASYLAAMRREIEEEVFLESAYTQKCVGLINDDLTDVGRVHLGIVHLFELEAPKVRPREESIIETGFASPAELTKDSHEFRDLVADLPRSSLLTV